MINSLTYKNKLIYSRTLAYTITSPIDTVRQNMLVQRNITRPKLVNGFVYASGMTVTLSNICYGLIGTTNANIMRSLIIGLFFMNFISTPLIYNYKRVVTGLPMEIINIGRNKKLFILSLLDDIMEEGLKYFLSTKFPSSPYRNKLIDTLLIILFTYPTDIIKNRITYNSSLTITQWDPIIKVSHKFIQTYLFFKIFNSFQ